MRPDKTMRYLKVVCGFACFLILASNVWSMSRWSEARGVYDDVCYLRLAHLFQRFGLGGLDTAISRDDDRYLAAKLKEIGFPTWSDTATAPCHTPMPATKKLVMQYPPGTGFVLSLFPQGFQVIPLYVSATVIVFGFALLAIFYARSRSSILPTGAFGCLAIYLMINPAKASYSIAPTMVVCALAGYLTARLFLAEQRQHRLLLTGFVGLLIGVAVNFRLPNLFLSSGYFLFFFASFLLSRKIETALQGMVFGAAFLAGIAPTLVANAINAGSAFSTTYGGVDVTPPDFSFGVIRSYLADMQFVLLVLAMAWTALILRWRRGNGVRQVALVTAGNLLVNLAFFLSHPVFTPYYTIPVAMLSLWSLLFASLMQPAEIVDDDLAGQAVKARSLYVKLSRQASWIGFFKAMIPSSIRIAVPVPCFNEEAAVATVVADFRKALPSAEIFVYDNNSTDRTIAVARTAGAQVRSERRQGKGHVVRRMFADIDADVYVLVDGDATYDAASAPRMIDALLSGRLDMVVGLRVDQAAAAYRRGHRTGNRMLTGFLASVFGQAFKDILSGYRVFSRRFVKSFPVLSDGFEIETELSVHALELALPVAELETPYYARPAASVTNLNTWRDGFRILGTILKLYRSEKPLRFFTAIGIFLTLVSIGLAIPIIITYLEQGVVPRLPTAVLSMGLMILAVLSVSSGLVLVPVTRGRREMKLLAYLSQAPSGKN